MTTLPVAINSVVFKSFERLLLSHLKDIKGPLLDRLQFTYQADWLVDNTVNNTVELHYIPHHLKSPRDVRQDFVFGLHLGVQHHHPSNSTLEAHPAHTAYIHLSVD